MPLAKGSEFGGQKREEKGGKNSIEPQRCVGKANDGIDGA